MGSFPVKNSKYSKKKKKEKGHDHNNSAWHTSVGTVPCHHKPEHGQSSCKKSKYSKKEKKKGHTFVGQFPVIMSLIVGGFPVKTK